MTAATRDPRRQSRATRSLLVATCASALFVPLYLSTDRAAASTVSEVGSHLVYGAGRGEVNELSVRLGPGGYRVVDTGARVHAGKGCIATNRHAARCSPDGVADAIVRLEDESDGVRVAGLGRVDIDAGAGDDLVIGSSGNDDLDGGAGHDTLYGGQGDDVVRGGGDEDYVAGGDGADDLDGGDGNDVLNGGNGGDRLDGGVGEDKLSAGAGIDGLFGGDGNDALDGGAAPDQLYGGNGSDTLDGGPDDDLLSGGPDADTLSGAAGSDRIYAEEGLDSILAIDGQSDTIDCGGDADLVHSDDSDTRVGCAPRPLPRLGLGAVAAPVLIQVVLPVKVRFPHRHVVQLLVKAASRERVTVVVRFLSRRGRALRSARRSLMTNQWRSLHDLRIPRGAHRVTGKCCVKP